MNYKRKSRRRFFLLTRLRTSLISLEFGGGGGLNTPNHPPRYATGMNSKGYVSKLHVVEVTVKYNLGKSV